MHITPLWLALPLLCAACSCQNSGHFKTASAAATMRVIIGFDETISPPAMELSSSLGRELGCELIPLQALGGNAYAYNCVTADSEETLTRKLNALGQYKGVRYAELERIRKIKN